MALPVARDEARSFDFDTYVSSLGRPALAAGLASLAGGLAAGVTGRLAMRAVAALDPEATGQLTEGGAVVGTITTDGSLFLIFLGTIFGVFVGSVMVIAFAAVVPGGTIVRAILFGLAMVALFGSALVTSQNADFVRFASPGANVLLFSAPLMAAGAVASVVNGLLGRRLPAPSSGSRGDHAYALVVALGVLLVVVSLMSLVGAGPWPLIVYVVALAYALARHALTAPWVPRLGRILLLAMCLIGGAMYVKEVASIL